jgi:hypothetical protein
MAKKMIIMSCNDELVFDIIILAGSFAVRLIIRCNLYLLVALVD